MVRYSTVFFMKMAMDGRIGQLLSMRSNETMTRLIPFCSRRVMMGPPDASARTVPRLFGRWIRVGSATTRLSRLTSLMMAWVRFQLRTFLDMGLSFAGLLSVGVLFVGEFFVSGLFIGVRPAW